jgi:hypothetical protein
LLGALDELFRIAHSFEILIVKFNPIKNPDFFLVSNEQPNNSNKWQNCFAADYTVFILLLLPSYGYLEIK